MKRYFLFEQIRYYPDGGMLDFVGDFDTLEEVEKVRTKGCDNDWDELGYHILDTHERKIVAGYCQYTNKTIKETPLNNFK